MNREETSSLTQDDSAPQRLLTLPNVLSAVRFAGSFAMLGLAWYGSPRAFLVAYLLLTATDWLDGKIAIRWNQRSVFGARLDSLADVTMYAAVLAGCIVLRGATMMAEWPWIAAPVASYAAAQAVAWWKFGRFAAYHTRTAKTSWLFMVPAVIALVLDWTTWPLRLGALSVTIANLESIGITSVLPQWRADVIWIGRAVEIRRAERRSSNRPETAS